MNIIIVGWNVDRGAWLVSGAFTTLILLACSNTNEPIVVESREIPNADKTKAAIVELVDNGLGFGLGLEYYEVHIEKPRQKPKAHGDKERWPQEIGQQDKCSSATMGD